MQNAALHCTAWERTDWISPDACLFVCLPVFACLFLGLFVCLFSFCLFVLVLFVLFSFAVLFSSACAQLTTYIGIDVLCVKVRLSAAMLCDLARVHRPQSRHRAAALLSVRNHNSTAVLTECCSAVASHSSHTLEYSPKYLEYAACGPCGKRMRSYGRYCVVYRIDLSDAVGGTRLAFHSTAYSAANCGHSFLWVYCSLALQLPVVSGASAAAAGAHVQCRADFGGAIGR